MKVPANVLDRQYLKYAEEYDKKIIEVLHKGYYVLGPEVEAFEQEFAEYCGSKFAVGLASGLDALWLTFRILGISKGDEVLVQSNTYIATVMGVTINDATPIFVEPDEFYNMDISKIEEKITDKTRAILVTHLYGQPANMPKIMEIAEKHDLVVVEDCAQAHGAMIDGKMVGTFGVVGCYSFYPSKNLGAFGDAGGIITDDPELAEKFKIYRNYGSEKRYYNEVVGANSRLDEVQAALLRIKLRHIGELEAERKILAERYLEKLDNPSIVLPEVLEGAKSVWHQFVIRTEHRDELMEYLKDNGVGSLIHYPIPPHLAEAYAYLGYKKGDFPVAEEYAETVLSLPFYNGMTEEEQDYVINKLNDWRKNG